LTLIVLATILHTDTSPSLADTDRDGTLVPPPWKHTLGLNRVGQTHLDIYSGYRKRFSAPQGVVAVKLHFNDEEGRGDDDELTVYGVNSGTGEILYNKSMVSLGFFGRETNDQRVFVEAVGITADAMGHVFVADRGTNRIILLHNNEQNQLGFVAAVDLVDSGRALRAPTDVALDGTRVFITDTGNNRIVETDLQGRYVAQITGDGGLSQPYGIDVITTDQWNFFGSRFIAVTDSSHQRLSMLSLDGTSIRSISYSEVSGSQGGFYFAAIDYYSNIYVTDQAGGCVYKFDRFLNYLTRIGCGRGSKDDLDEPRGITIYRRFGQVFVAERAGASYLWVGTDVQNLRCTASREGDMVGLNIRFVLTERSTVTVRLESADGELVKTIADNALMHPGSLTRTYRVPANEIPCPIANCKYRLTIQARPTYSSRNYHSVERSTPVRRP
jgi:hypothetical protein